MKGELYIHLPVFQVFQHISKYFTIFYNMLQLIFLWFSPPARWGLLDFITAVPAPPPPPSPPPSPPPPLPPLPRPLPPCQLFALRQLPRAMGTAGPQLPASDLSGHGWTSTARFWAQWAPLDLNQGPSEPSGHRWTSAARWNARIYAR